MQQKVEDFFVQNATESWGFSLKDWPPKWKTSNSTVQIPYVYVHYYKTVHAVKIYMYHVTDTKCISSFSEMWTGLGQDYVLGQLPFLKYTTKFYGPVTPLFTHGYFVFSLYLNMFQRSLSNVFTNMMTLSWSPIEVNQIKA